MAAQLEPLRIGQILDRSLKLLPAVFRAVLVPYLLLAVAVTLLLVPQIDSDLGLKLATWIIEISLSIYTGIRTVFVAAALWKGDESLLKGEISFSLLGRLFTLGMWQCLIGILLMFLFIIPGLIYWMNRMFAQYFMILDDIEMNEALRRSKYLMTRGRWYHTDSPPLRLTGLAIVLILMGFFGGIVQGVGKVMWSFDTIGGVTSVIPGVILGYIGALCSALVVAYSTTAYIGFFYDLRVRYEGIDLLGQISELSRPDTIV